MMKWLRNLLKGMSLTAALFVFQACYGTPAGAGYPVPEEKTNEAAADTTLVSSSEEAGGVSFESLIFD